MKNFKLFLSCILVIVLGSCLQLTSSTYLQITTHTKQDCSDDRYSTQWIKMDNCARGHVYRLKSTVVTNGASTTSRLTSILSTTGTTSGTTSSGSTTGSNTDGSTTTASNTGSTTDSGTGSNSGGSTTAASNTGDGGSNTASNTVGSNTASNTAGSNTASNTAGSNTASNTAGSNTASNTAANTAGSNTASNTAGSNTAANTAGSNTGLSGNPGTDVLTSVLSGQVSSLTGFSSGGLSAPALVNYVQQENAELASTDSIVHYYCLSVTCASNCIEVDQLPIGTCSLYGTEFVSYSVVNNFTLSKYVNVNESSTATNSSSAPPSSPLGYCQSFSAVSTCIAEVTDITEYNNNFCARGSKINCTVESYSRYNCIDANCNDCFEAEKSPLNTCLIRNSTGTVYKVDVPSYLTESPIPTETPTATPSPTETTQPTEEPVPSNTIRVLIEPTISVCCLIAISLLLLSSLNK
ncbi:hypothetical protein CYY_005998 [Polysphondylium violaceum]|uniref:Uncharacterized protein n=1 Tax=Polysphondylium violaceum TaxID=133409 RepID=A0A8J4V3L7_9MYCE|nr:hypothetical protein CYY_005998 [Polysphondylium violaceum]